MTRAILPAKVRALAIQLRNPKVRQWIETMISLGSMAALQLVGFLILARMLGAHDYAVIVAVAAVVSIIIELVGLGCGDVLVRAVSRDPGSHRRAVGEALILISATFPVAFGIGALAIHLFFDLGAKAHIPLALLFSELVSSRALGLSEQMAIAQGHIRLGNLYRVIPQLTRVGLILTAGLLLGVQSLEGWWLWQFGYNVIVPVLAALHALSRFGWPIFTMGAFRPVDNIFFAMTQTLRAMQFNVDRLFIGYFSSQAALGQYGVAARLIQYSLLPVQSVLRMTYPEYFRRGRSGFAVAARYGYKVTGILIALMLPVSLGIFLLADIFVLLLGPGFAGAEGHIRVLAFLPLMAAIQYGMADVLTGADMQKVRTATLAVGTLLIGVFAALAARFYGAAMVPYAVLAANALLAAFFTIVVLSKMRAERRRAAALGEANPAH